VAGVGLATDGGRTGAAVLVGAAGGTGIAVELGVGAAGAGLLELGEASVLGSAVEPDVEGVGSGLGVVVTAGSAVDDGLGVADGSVTAPACPLKGTAASTPTTTTAASRARTITGPSPRERASGSRRRDDDRVTSR
jgi:hypothetical protein